MKGMKRIRQGKNISLRKLDSMVGIAFTNLSKYETGKQIPTVLTAKKIADALGCTIDDLLN